MDNIPLNREAIYHNSLIKTEQFNYNLIDILVAVIANNC